jgi:hypothetical protein
MMHALLHEAVVAQCIQRDGAQGGAALDKPWLSQSLADFCGAGKHKRCLGRLGVVHDYLISWVFCCAFLQPIQLILQEQAPTPKQLSTAAAPCMHKLQTQLL